MVRSTLAQRAWTLPAEVTSFVGRRNELASIGRLLATHRLVTLLGVGGVGKTRLAIRAAHDLRENFPDGVHLVDLAELSDPTLLAQTVGSVLGLRDDSPERPADRLVDLLADTQPLIVLDNCEHLITECAVLVDRLLAACPNLRVLATSRTSLQIEAECTLPLQPLSVPESDEELGPDALSGFDAVRLFTARASASLPDFEITEENWTTVAELCRQLDGIPLAIELAAVRIRVLSVQQILDGLSDRYHLLTHGSRTALPRQRTLRSLMDWSFDLLTEGAKRMWARSSVFARSFELDAAAGVCADDGLPEADVLDLVTELVDKSVLLRDEQHGRVRYQLLEAVREYGLHRLRESGELEKLRGRHRDWYADLAAQAKEGLEDGTQLHWYRRLRAEHPNLRAALDHCGTDPAFAPIGLRLCADLKHYWVMTGSFSEGRRWLRALLSAAPLAPERIGGLTVAARLAVLQGDTREGLRQLTEARDLAGPMNQEHWLPEISHTEGIASLFWADPGAALAHFADALDGHKAAGNPFGVMLALIQSASAHSMLEDTSLALELCEECLEISAKHDDQWCAAMAKWTKALLWWHLGDHGRAEQLARETLRIKRSFADRLGMAMAMELIAWVAGRQHRYRRAAELLGVIESARRSVGATSLFQHLAEGHEECMRLTKRALGEIAWQESFGAGKAFDFDEAVELALRKREGAPSPVPRADSELTAREHEIAGLIARGMSNRDIAAELSISPRTAEKHVEKILTKLGLSSRTQVVVWAATRHELKPKHAMGA